MIFPDNWDSKYRTARPRRLLTFDGGGIRGIISLEIARKIET
jgi:patatin-like phospholipase/acyl hydrolase